jgi:Hydrazine synthase alpha subunit middle domain
MNKSICKLTAAVAIAVSSVSLIGCAPESGEGADPGIIDLPIVYAKRTILVDDDGNFIAQDVRRPLTFRAGGDLFIKQRSLLFATEKNITESVTTDGVGKKIGDVRDVESSYDGTKLIFSLRIDDPDDNGDDKNNWTIYEYDIATESLTAILPDKPGVIPDFSPGAAVIPDKGDDIAPHYLPDGRIVFSSNMQHESSSVNLDEATLSITYGKAKLSSLDERLGVKALNLHVMDADGDNLKQISNNQSHDLDPTVLPNGKILFSRWDNAGFNNVMDLYTVNPDGSGLEIFYGAHSASHPGGMQFVQPRVMSDGKILVLTQGFRNTFGGLDIFAIDGNGFVDSNQPVKPISVNPGVTGPAQVKATTATITDIDATVSTNVYGSRYSSAFPLDDGSGRLLVSKGSCQITNTILDPDDPNFDPNLIPPVVPLVIENCIAPFTTMPVVNEMPPIYGIWMHQTDGSELPVVLPEAGKFITDIIGVSPKTRPPIIQDKGTLDLDQTLNAREGILNIRSVYDFGGGASSFNGCFLDDCIPTAVMTNNTPSTADDIVSVRDLYDPARTNSTDLPARFLRIVKAVGICDPDDAGCNPMDLENEAFGPDRRLGMREIIGYTMIQPDGSVRVKVPSNVGFYIEVLDAKGRRILKRETNGALRRTRHDNWLQVRSKDTLECTGCHTHVPGATPLPHARNDAIEPQLTSGLQADGTDLINTNVYAAMPVAGAKYFGDTGDTMAEILTRQFPDALNPSLDLLYVDVWTDPGDVSLTVEAPVSVRYQDLDASTRTAPTQKIVAASCEDTATDLLNPNWDARCRMIINYEEHIAPIWSVVRGVAGVDTCTSCHSKDGLVDPQVPAGYLDLGPGLDDDDANPLQLESYRELFFSDNRQEVNGMNVLTDILVATNVPRVDGNGDPVLDPISGLQIIDVVLLPDTTDPQTPSMTEDGARASYFIEKMTGETLNVSTNDRNRVTWALAQPPTVNHVGLLTDAELKLISEWLDIGAQYFNNPVHPNAPRN